MKRSSTSNEVVTPSVISTTPAAFVGTVITDRGVRYKRISGEEAFRIRCDVQLYSWDGWGIIQDQWNPEYFRRACSQILALNYSDHSFWKDIDWFVKIEEDKPEYGDVDE